MVNKSLVEIFKNIPGDGCLEWEDSFYGYLSEHGEWDLDKFWVLHKALIDIAKEIDDELSVSRELSYALLYIQQNVLI
ncbi:immunity 41 family protein [Aliamphritea ceti]|uniref:immunity 41 family protein n=1 Tax=Aliamphritea ceti TaxID=1524258 RepID=UPI0021C30686|nr:immunity 41 family protein [Aliamphritea ceti]